MTDDDIQWGATENALRDQYIAGQALLVVLTLMRRLGDTVEASMQAGTRHFSSPTACAWFDATKGTINVSFNHPGAAGARREFYSLAATGFNGRLGNFDVDEVTIADDSVVITFVKNEPRTKDAQLVGAAQM